MDEEEDLVLFMFSQLKQMSKIIDTIAGHDMGNPRLIIMLDEQLVLPVVPSCLCRGCGMEVRYSMTRAINIGRSGLTYIRGLTYIPPNGGPMKNNIPSSCQEYKMESALE